jgi:PAS domain S-box-containing protein
MNGPGNGPVGRTAGRAKERPLGRREAAERKPLRVVLVEDSEDDALLVLRELRRGGYEPKHERVDSPEALRTVLAASECWPDVVISDYYMPRFSAPDALRVLREEGCDAPVVVVSGKVGEDAAVAAMRAGARDYVMKDNLKRLVPVVEREIEEARVRAESREAEQARRRAEEEYRTIFERSVEGIFRTTVGGRVAKANPAFARMFGYESPQEMIGAINNIANDAYAEPERRDHLMRLMQERGVVRGFVFRARRHDGSHFWASLNAWAVRDEAGGIAGFEGAVEDVTEQKEAEEGLKMSLERLVALHEAGQMLGSTLEAEEIGTRLLRTACRVFGLSAAVISLRRPVPTAGPAHAEVWRSVGSERLGEETRRAEEARAALRAALNGEPPRPFRVRDAEGGELVGLCLPLRARERVAGVLECYGPPSLTDPGTATTLESLAAQAASALENARLYGELSERERRLQELVGKILVAQEEERRRVAYEVHDGLAQYAAAAHQHLQAYAHYHPPETEEAREDLERVAGLVRGTVGEARRIIADLRPTALDDLGLRSAIRLHLDSLRAEGWQVSFRESIGDDARLPAAVETAVFRVTQEALNNVGKHAGTKRVDVRLERRPEGIRLKVRDYGRGFEPDEGGNGAGPGERIGLTGMRERISLLGGDFRIASRPGLGTLVLATVPLLGESGG